MAVKVLTGGEGSLEFSASLDTASLENSLKDTLQKGTQEFNAFNTLIEKTGDQLAESFNPATVNKFAAALKEANDSIAPLLQKGAGNIDPSKLVELQKQTEGATSDFERLQQVIAFIKQNIDDFKLNPDEINQFNQAVQLVEQTFTGLTEKQKTALTQLRNLKDQLATKGTQDPGFEDNFKAAAELEKKLKDVNAQLKLASSHAPGIQAATQAFRGLVGGFEAIAGATALFSSNNEAAEKAVKSLVASMGVLQGIEEVMAVLEKDSALNVFLQSKYRELVSVAAGEQAIATEAVASAEIAETAAAAEATIATEGLNAAMAANPAGVLLLTMGALIAIFQSFSSETEDATKKQKSFFDRIKEVNEALASQAEELKLQRERQLEPLKEEIKVLEQSAGKTDELAKKRKELFDLQRKNAEESLKDLNVSEESLKQMNDRIQFLETRLQSLAGKTQKETKRILQEDIRTGRVDILTTTPEQIQRQIADEKKRRDAALQAINDVKAANTESHLLTIQQTREALKNAQAAADAELALAKKNTKEELDLRIKAINARVNSEAAGAGLSREEQQRIVNQGQKEIQDARRAFQILELNNQKSIIQARLDAVKVGSKEELDLKIDLINQTSQIELAQEGVTQARATEIEAGARKERLELIKKFNAEGAQAELESVIAGINERLSKVQDGSDEELQLKKELIDAKADLEASGLQLSIQNEELLAAKIKEINARAAKDKKDADDRFTNHQLENQLRIIERTNDILNAPLQTTANNPFSTLNQKFEAQREIFKNNLDSIKKELNLLDEDIKNNTGDINRLTERRLELVAKQKKAEGDLANLEDRHTVDVMRKIAADVGSVANSLHGLSAALKESNPELSKFIDSLADVGNLVSTAASAFASFQTGDIAGGIASTVGFISGFINVLNKGREERKRQQQELDDFQQKVFIGEQEINLLYRERLRDQARLNQLKLEGLRIEKETLENQKRANADQFNQLLAQLQKLQGKQVTTVNFGLFSKDIISNLSLVGKSFDDLEQLFLKGQLEGKAKELFETLQKIKQEGVDIDALLKSNTEEAKQVFTGTTAASITDSIIDGFKNGLRSASDFADTFQELMQNAILQALKFQALQKPLDAFFDQFALSAESDQVLTDDEIRALHDKFTGIIDDAGKKFEELQKITGIGFTGSAGGKSLTGAIRGITAEQADLLAGQFGGLRLTAIEQLRTLVDNLKELQLIESNTFQTVEELRSMQRKMDFYYSQKGVKVY